MARTTRDPKTNQFTISLNAAQFEAVMAEVAARDISQSQVVREAINLWRRAKAERADA